MEENKTAADLAKEAGIGTKATRTPRSFDSILAGAKALPLKERVDLANALTVTINAEVAALKQAAADAEKLIFGQ